MLSFITYLNYNVSHHSKRRMAKHLNACALASLFIPGITLLIQLTGLLVNYFHSKAIVYTISFLIAFPLIYFKDNFAILVIKLLVRYKKNYGYWRNKPVASAILLTFTYLGVIITNAVIFYLLYHK